MCSYMYTNVKQHCQYQDDFSTLNITLMLQSYFTLGQSREGAKDVANSDAFLPGAFGIEGKPDASYLWAVFRF